MTTIYMLIGAFNAQNILILLYFKLQTFCYKENGDFAIFHHFMTRYVYESVKTINS